MHTSNARSRATAGAGALILIGAAAPGVVSPAATAAVRPHVGLARVTSVELAGRGWGPGIGMGQWGDFGYAVRYHFNYEQILNHYYGGTVASSLPFSTVTQNPMVSVVILENANLTTNVGYDPVVTSSAAFTVSSQGTGPASTAASTTTSPATTSTTAVATTTTAAGSPTTLATTPVTTAAPTTPAPVPTSSGSFGVPAGTAVDFRLQSNGTWNAYEASSCTAALAVTPGAAVATGLVNPVAAPPTTAGAFLTLCRHDGQDEPVRGSLEAYDRQGYERTLNVLPLESYLEGVVPAEESASWGTDGGKVGAPQGQAWGFQALEAQAVAARSYTVANMLAGGWNGYASICDTVECQAYVGESYETPVSDAAVAATQNEIRLTAGTVTGPGIVSTRYSASTGGWTAPGSFPAVRDRGDACVVPGNALECNPDHEWTTSEPASLITKQWRSIGKLIRVHVSERNKVGALGGRALVVVLSGTTGVVDVTGDEFAAALGLRSDWFAIAHLTRAGAPLVATATTTSTSAVTTTTLATSASGATIGNTGTSGPVGSSVATTTTTTAAPATTTTLATTSTT